jgi:phage-related protein
VGETWCREAAGVRAIYFWAARESAFYMLHAYAKNEQGDLTPKQAKALAALIREEFK